MKFGGFDGEEDAEKWARKKLGLDSGPNFFRAMSAVDNDGEYVCVVVFTGFSSINIDINIAMNGKKMTPKGTIEMFNKVFSFCFDELHVQRVTGLTGMSNKKAKNIIEHFGFKLEGVMRKAMPEGEDMAVYGFLADEFHNHAWCERG